MSDGDQKSYKYQLADKDVPPRPPTPTELDWQIDAAHRSGKHISFEITPPPADQDTNHGTRTNRPSTPKSGQNSSLFVPPDLHQSVYKATSLANFPAAGELEDGKLVKSSEFKAKTSMVADGVQHSMYAGWQNQGESGTNSQKQEWFEKRD